MVFSILPLLGGARLSEAFASRFESAAVRATTSRNSARDRFYAARDSGSVTDKGLSEEGTRITEAAFAELVGIYAPLAAELVPAHNRLMKEGDFARRLSPRDVLTATATPDGPFPGLDLAMRAERVRTRIAAMTDDAAKATVLSAFGEEGAEPDMVRAYAVDSLGADELAELEQRTGLSVAQLRTRMRERRLNTTEAATLASLRAALERLRYDAGSAAKTLGDTLDVRFDTGLAAVEALLRPVRESIAGWS